ncbi:Uncharacterised protein [Rikenella microfusus]|uniref:Uncharacterized protein n=1 Tax=Rikenella microfusus TaxID=28139 RepID=A0A379MPA5_9BACT|nr:Uncharacterised protein [Rikenella microfusus]
MFPLCQAGATPGGGLQLRCACFGSAGSGHKINRTVKWPGHVLRPLGRAGRSLAPRRPARSRGSFAVSAGCDPRQITVRFLWMRFSRIAGLCVQAALRLPGIGAKHFIYDEDRTSGRSGASQKTSVKTIDHREIIGFRFIRPAFRFPDPVLILSVTSRIGSGTAATIRKKPASPFRESGPAKDVSGISARIRRRSRSLCRPR